MTRNVVRSETRLMRNEKLLALKTVTYSEDSIKI